MKLHPTIVLLTERGLSQLDALVDARVSALAEEDPKALEALWSVLSTNGWSIDQLVGGLVLSEALREVYKELQSHSVSD